MEEIWLDIPDYDGIYQVSNIGRIKRISSEIYCKDGKIKKIKGRYLKLLDNIYDYVILSKDGVKKHYAVHRLVAEAFIPNPGNKKEVDHINTNKKDNNVNNLRWVTKVENMNNPLTLALKRKKVVCLDTGIVFESAKDAEAKTGVCRKMIGDVCRGRRKTTSGLRWAFA